MSLSHGTKQRHVRTSTSLLVLSLVLVLVVLRQATTLPRGTGNEIVNGIVNENGNGITDHQSNGAGGILFVSGFLGSPSATVPLSRLCPQNGSSNHCNTRYPQQRRKQGRRQLPPASSSSFALFLQRPGDANTNQDDDEHEHDNDNETNPGGGSNPSFETVASTSTSTTTPNTNTNTKPSTATPPRTIRIERMPRLPVWPVWAGVVDFLVGWILGPEAGSRLEQYVLGGRVCPMQLDGTTTSPFLLLVHHHHNFWKWDALFRRLSALVLPEGFPAHPHRGFTTLTYFLPPDGNNNNNKRGGGGFVHRDSIGVKQTYGSEGSYQHQAQWLFTGRGMLHEEMFDFVQRDGNNDYDSRYELYQLWVNVPGRHKLDPPEVQLLRTATATATATSETDDNNGGTDTMPTVSTTHTVGNTTTTCSVVVVAGNYHRYQSGVAPLHSDLSVLHVAIGTEAAATRDDNDDDIDGLLPPSSSPGWTYDIPPDHDTLIVYVRKGSCTMETIAKPRTAGSSSSSSNDDDDAAAAASSGATEVPIHSTVFVEATGAARTTSSRSRSGIVPCEQLVVRPIRPEDPVDLLVLSGRPLYDDSSSSSSLLSTPLGAVEPVAMQGSMVMNNEFQIQEAYRDYQMGRMGVPWDHELNDEEWREHVRRTTATRMQP
mmetsp:Transcript_26088/g.54645  ORF Transcript_26088/g.54645 Transcript_26088/m.54645 type:complete len:656 (-) Transcript_26088:153-2120(-)